MIEFLLIGEVLNILYVRCDACSHHYFIFNGMGECPIKCRSTYTCEDCTKVKLDKTLSGDQFQQYLEKGIKEAVKAELFSFREGMEANPFRTYYNNMTEEERKSMNVSLSDFQNNDNSFFDAFTNYFFNRYEKEQH